MTKGQLEHRLSVLYDELDLFTDNYSRIGIYREMVDIYEQLTLYEYKERI